MSRTKNLPTLSPCPFDGGKAVFRGGPRDRYVYIECSNGKCKSCGQFYRSHETAARAWNRRDGVGPSPSELFNSMMVISDYGECLMAALELLAKAEGFAPSALKRQIKQTVRRIRKKIHRRQQITAKLFKKKFGKAVR